MSRPPIIVETERLVLHPHGLEDFEDCAALWADEAVARQLGGRVHSREDAWARLLRYAGHWSLKGYGFWAVVDKASGRFAGETGFADFQRDMVPPLGDAPEAGWVLARWAHGRGIASEAAAAGHAWLTQHLGPVRTVCIVKPDNAPSLRVAEKCGYRMLRTADYKGSPVSVLERAAA